MAETLEQGLVQIFGGATTEASAENTSVTTADVTALTQDDAGRIQSAITAYEEALRAQMDGEWALYGEAIERLGTILKQ